MRTCWHGLIPSSPIARINQVLRTYIASLRANCAFSRSIDIVYVQMHVGFKSGRQSMSNHVAMPAILNSMIVRLIVEDRGKRGDYRRSLLQRV